MFLIVSGLAVVGSAERTTKSASLPTVIDPFRSSSKEAKAPPSVQARKASSATMRCRHLPPKLERPGVQIGAYMLCLEATTAPIYPAAPGAGRFYMPILVREKGV